MWQQLRHQLLCLLTLKTGEHWVVIKHNTTHSEATWFKWYTLNCVAACTRRSIWTDHGNFVLFNVYVPNAGDRPERARLQAKVAFLQSLKERVDVLVGSGRQVLPARLQYSLESLCCMVAESTCVV